MFKRIYLVLLFTFLTMCLFSSVVFADVTMGPYASCQCHMIGIPVATTGAVAGDPETLFDDDHAGAIGAPNWRISRYDYQTGGYKRWGETNYLAPAGNPAAMVYGLGYWYRQGEGSDVTLDITDAQIANYAPAGSNLQVALNAPDALETYRGLIQLANPYTYTYEWDQTYIYNHTNTTQYTLADAVTNGYVSAYAYVWDPVSAAYSPVDPDAANNDIAAHKGFFYEQLDANVSLSIEFVPNGLWPPFVPGGDGNDDVLDDVDRWELNLQVKSTTESYSDPYNRAGVRSESVDGFDGWDASEMPPMAPYVQLFFAHPEWDKACDVFTFDYRDPDLSEAKVWDFTVRTNSLANHEFELSWPNIDELDENLNFQLIQTDDNIIIGDIRQLDSYIFSSGNDPEWSVTHFQLVVSLDGMEDVAENSNEIPSEFLLSAAYPNPFNPSTAFQVNLPHYADLGIAVYNSIGQQVAVIQNGPMSAGIHEFTFNANGLSSGIYFIRAEMKGKAVQMQKIVFMR